MPKYPVSINQNPAVQPQSFDLLFVSLRASGKVHCEQESFVEAFVFPTFVLPCSFDSRLSLSYYPVHRYPFSLPNTYTYTHQEVVLEASIISFTR